MKTRIVFGLLVAFAIWPLVHNGLVHTVRMDPWKFGGWSMYIVPQRPPLLEVVLETREGSKRLRASDLSPAAMSQAHAYSGYRRIRREKLPPDRLARRILFDHREARAVRIRVQDFSLDPDTARVRLTPYEYRYPQSG